MLQLSDNDDYMRFHQFTSWIQEGNWYLKPMESFNPEDGELIHWSRLPDIPLAAITIFTSPWLGSELSESLAITITPIFYLIALLLAVSLITYRLGGPGAAKIAIFMTVLSPVVTKFLPGSIDHHNIQLVLIAWVIALVPFNKTQSRQLYNAWSQGLLIALSFWVGMENLLVIALILLIMTTVGYYYTIRLIEYSKHVCLSAIIFIGLFIIINRPFTEFFITRYDAISFPYLLTFGCGYLFCQLSIISFKLQSLRKIPAQVRYPIIAVITVSPLMITFPTIVFGVYYNYPELLKEYWLNHVIEAKSIIRYISDNGFFNKYNFLLFLIPALLSISISYKNTINKIFYFALIISLIAPTFWQVRTIYTSMIIAIPLQAIFCEAIMNRYSNQALRIAVLLLCLPLTTNYITKTIEHYSKSVSVDNSKTLTHPIDKKNNLYKVEALISNKVENSLILAPIEFGAPILALTSNKVISAPYHRNIDGNKITIELFISTNTDLVKETITNKSIQFVMIGRDSNSKITSMQSSNNSFINQLIANKPPHWLSLVEETPNGVKLYRVN